MIRLFLLMIILTISSVFSENDSSQIESKQRLDLGVSFVYGFNSLNSFGGSAEIVKGWQIWKTRHTQGMVNCGILAGYQVEPFSQSNSILNGAISSGAAHRIEGLLILGTTVHLPPARRLLFGIDLFGGWTHVIMNGSFTNSKYNISGDYKADKGVFASGLIVDLGYSITDRVSIVSKTFGPFPYAECAVTPFIMETLGVSIKLK